MFYASSYLVVGVIRFTEKRFMRNVEAAEVISKNGF